MNAVEVFADVVCPFTHAGLRRLFAERARRRSTRPIRVRAWPLERINGKPLDPALVEHEIEGLHSVAPNAFRGFDRATFPKTSMPAFGLAAAGYAIDDPTGETVSLALRYALFEHGADIGRADVIDCIARELRVPQLDEAAAEAAVREDWERGKALGVLGSPHFFDGARNWFCPTLEIAHLGEIFDVSCRSDLAEFYDEVFV